MNKRPVSYLQTDARWKNKPYRVKGENSTIGSAGCGPTCAAMLIETITGRTFTPEAACMWSMERGYKALNQGTYYSYFVPQFAEFGISCDMLNWVSTYGKPDHANHAKAFGMLKEGYYLIALMNKGLWTRSGHFVVVWWADGKVHINDPASTKAERLSGDLRTFKSQVKYYWWVDARRINTEEDDDMPFTQKDFDAMMEDYLSRQQKQEPGEWSAEAREWAEKNGIIYGDAEGKKMYRAPCTREHMVVFLHRIAEKLGLA